MKHSAQKPLSLSDFEGAWHVSRMIRHDDGGKAQFAGMAQFDAEKDGLAYCENGMLRIGSTVLAARQRHYWDVHLGVRFADGRFFHRVPPMGGAVTHHCPPDHYVGVYDFSNWPLFRVSWCVTGPRKAYLSETFYSRALHLHSRQSLGDNPRNPHERSSSDAIIGTAYGVE